MAEAVNPQANILLSPDDGETVWLRKLGIRFMIGGEDTRGNFALVEYLIGARALEPSSNGAVMGHQVM